MARLNNCIHLTCDRCGYSEYRQSINHAQTIGWELEVKIPDETPKDLCPKCSERWGELLHDFLYGEIEKE